MFDVREIGLEHPDFLASSSSGGGGILLINIHINFCDFFFSIISMVESDHLP